MKPTALLISLLLFLLCAMQGNSQSDPETSSAKKQKRFGVDHISISFTNSHTSMPFGKFVSLLTDEFHPGFEVGTGISWKNWARHDLFQEFKFGYSYHRWVQHSLVFYTEFGYRYKFPKGFGATAKLGGGYMRAIVANQVFADGPDNGEQYGKITSGRSQAIVTGSIGISQTFQKPRCTLFLEYQQRLQTPFIQSYVPMLPYNIIMVGFRIPLKK